MMLSELLAHNPSLDCEVEVEPDDIVTDVVVLLRAVQLEDRTDGLIIGTPEGTAGIVQYGMVCAAQVQLQAWMTHIPGE